MAPPANAATGDVARSGAVDFSRLEASPLDRKVRELPSYSPPTYSTQKQTQQTPLLQPSSPDVKVLPFRELNSELPPIQNTQGRENGESRHRTLPSISSVTGSVTGSVSGAAADSPAAEAASASTPASTNHWPSLNPLTAYYTPGHVQSSADSPLRMDVDASSTSTGPTGATSPDRYLDVRAASVSLEDPDVRMAAEALGDLRADFVSSPPARSSPLPGNPNGNGINNTSEPLFSLLTTSHPLLAKTIEGTTSAYNTSKNFSPRFKSGAEYVEGYLTPIGNTIGSVSRVTGVEGGVRWFLGGGRRRHQSGEGESSKPSFYKRRKVDFRRGRGGNGTDAQHGPTSAGGAKNDDSRTDGARDVRASGDNFDLAEDRRLSMSTVETLPAYDDHRSPDYTESDGTSLMQIESAGSLESVATSTGSPAANNQQSQQAWQSRLIMSTSGLSVAMSEESLRSLKYCLNWLRWANGNIDKVIESLKTAVEQYDNAHAEQAEREASQTGAESAAGNDAAAQAQRNELAARIASLRGDLLQTLRGAVDTVSKYAGGALPDNARVLVRRHLTSLPQRFRLANQAEASAAEANGGRPATDKEVREGAQRVLVLAKEGLDMMSQVSGVLDGTIVSAEEWCERLGKKKPSDSSTQATPAATPVTAGADGDVVMQ
ncbi:transcriptional regulator opi1 [Sporothrix stenoceras]|uniref:Transcriptional regulator opi1 n=1 Tax=Sporothrix stenoceras TaxID=5173 RepID=A0ABR3ZNY0_9PEZI